MPLIQTENLTKVYGKGEAAVLALDQKIARGATDRQTVGRVDLRTVREPVLHEAVPIAEVEVRGHLLSAVHAEAVFGHRSTFGRWGCRA